jgi:hypothetical protein
MGAHISIGFESKRNKVYIFYPEDVVLNIIPIKII